MTGFSSVGSINNDTFLLAPLALHTGMPYITCLQMVHIIMGQNRITVLQHLAWDRDAVRQAVDIISMFDNVIATLSQLRTAAGLRPGQKTIHTRELLEPSQI